MKICLGRWVTLPNGQHICIDDKWNKIAVGAAMVIVLSGLAGGGLSAAAASSTADSIAAQTVKTRTTNGRDAARKGRSIEAWQRMALRDLKKLTRQDLTCIVHSTGQVRDFFLHEPCRSLHRELIPLADAQGNIIIVAVAWVRMYTSASASRLQDLIDLDGTGGFLPLDGSLLGWGGIRFTGQHFATRRSGSLVVVAEATPGSGQPDPGVLDGVAQVAAEFPPP